MIKVHNIEHMTYDGVAAVAASRHTPQSLTTAVGIVIMADSDTSCTERSPASSSRMSPKRGRGTGPSKGQSKGRGRGRGRGRPRSRAKSSGQDTDLTDVNKKAQTAGSDTETSESPETLRTAEAEKAWQATMKRPKPSCLRKMQILIQILNCQVYTMWRIQRDLWLVSFHGYVRPS